MEEVKETQPKKKGSAKTKKQKDTEETIVENNEIVNEVAPVEEPTTTTEDAPKPEPTTEEAPKTEETTPVVEEPKETVAKPEPVKPVEEPKEDAKPKNETVAKPEVKNNTAKKAVPTIAELRKMRKFNESVFKFSDGFACTATSQRTANAKHNAWLAGE